MALQQQTASQASHYDIVIVGAGPVGLMLSTCLARWGYKIKHIDNRPEPTATGRADGIQPRSLDLLRNMGLKSAIMAHKPARVFEVAFWDPSDTSSGIQRTGTWASCPDFVDARYPFTTLLHQGHIEQVFLSDLEKNGVEVQRPWTITGFQSDESQSPEHPVTVQLEHVDGNVKEQIHAKYLFGGEGSRSFVRQQLNIGIRHKDPISHVWGVMDGVVQTNFPDIKMKCTIHSHHGSIMVIPREDNMVRLYIQIASSTDPDWNPRKTATAEQVQESAKKIFQPYSITWERVEWYSVYPIGQGLSDRYSLDQRVFLGGDACHTHSPKAGQGMNTAFLDAQNLAWKIHAVEAGFATRDILKTYEVERRSVAEALLDFDNRYAKLFSQRPPEQDDVEAASKSHTADEMTDSEFIKTFKESCEFTSGYGVSYGPNELNWSSKHVAQSPLIHPTGTTLTTGRIFKNSDVTRVSDANVVHLEQEVPWNGSFRLFLFAGNPGKTATAVADFAHYMQDTRSFYASYLREDIDDVSHHERHNPHSKFFTICTILAAKRHHIEIEKHLPPLLARYRDHVYADDRWDRHFPNADATAHARMGLDPEDGGVVVVRPDGYVAIVVRLVEGSGTVEALNDYFSAFCTKKMGGLTAHLGQEILTSPRWSFVFLGMIGNIRSALGDAVGKLFRHDHAAAHTREKDPMAKRLKLSAAPVARDGDGCTEVKAGFLHEVSDLKSSEVKNSSPAGDASLGSHSLPSPPPSPKKREPVNHDDRIDAILDEKQPWSLELNTAKAKVLEAQRKPQVSDEDITREVIPKTEWLNDEIVNGVLSWLDQAVNHIGGVDDPKTQTRKCLVMTSFYYKQIKTACKNTQRTLKRKGVTKDNLLSVNTILLPICEHSHWTLMVINPSKKTVAHIDSLNPRGTRSVTELALMWMKDALDDKFVATEWKTITYNHPAQTNGYDCGVHTICNAICVAVGVDPSVAYKATDMPALRVQMSAVLVNGGFTGELDLLGF
ncbi:phenol 2-monooxygenase [Cordyceps fumosorosea ARSEF 2679]|uniref:Phenol 2-monooxygenase n=1 Tax=Cordyceps fumosorosea (strain ARSEF 2679) TaxID=1081104 RepID=A0A167RQH1_CORFA|nr:phenol 2-monooxygenase [Cordyceps fumosorosea ARSEF 2679]OAA58831.1 phenol 2-monooxygenase [Cordyceps fumosorosea ARSEF 2679]